MLYLFPREPAFLIRERWCLPRGRSPARLRRGPLPGKARRGAGGVHAGGRGPARMAAVRPRLGSATAAPCADRGRYDSRRTRPALRLLVAEYSPHRVPRRGVGRGRAVRVRLRDAPRARRARRGTFRRRVEPRRRLGLLRRLRLLQTETPAYMARLSVRQTAAKALPPGLDPRDGRGRDQRETAPCLRRL